MEVATDAECQDIMEDIDVSQSLLCAGGGSNGVCSVSFLAIFVLASFRPQHFSSWNDLFRATAGAL